MKKLESIELSRGIACLLVVFFHATVIMSSEKYYGIEPFQGFWNFGYSGVDFFFVLSGFIIYYSSQKLINAPNGVFTYLKHRIIRIYPTYWAVFIIIFLIGIIFFDTHLSLENLIKDILLFPRQDMPYITVAWTLRHEMLFYILFCSFFIGKRFGWTVIITWQLLILFFNISQYESNNPLFSLFLSLHNFEFLFGLIIGYLYLSKYKFNVFFTYLGISLFLMLGIVDSYSTITIEFKHFYLTYGVASCFIMMGLLNIEASRNISVNKLGLLIGKASYSIYLIHYAALSATIKIIMIFENYIPIWLGFILLVCSGVFAGILFHLFAERKLLTAFK